MLYSASLKFNHVFRRLYATKGFAAPSLVLYARHNRLEKNRLGITVSKKLGHAVVRNRARRRIREAYRLNESQFAPGWDFVVVARSKAVDCPFDKLCSDLMNAAAKAGALRREETI